MHVGSLGYVPPVRTSTAAGKQNVGNLQNKIKAGVTLWIYYYEGSSNENAFPFFPST